MTQGWLNIVIAVKPAELQQIFTSHNISKYTLTDTIVEILWILWHASGKWESGWNVFDSDWESGNNMIYRRNSR